MSILVTPQGVFKLYQFDTEKEFEQCVVSQVEMIFGKRCVYLDCKDAYLIDFSSQREPKLFIVETEIASHDLFQHIGVQILQFAHSFANAPRQVKQLLFDEISKDTKVYDACESYAQQYGLRNVDNMLDHLVNDTFRALIIIDEATDELYKVVKNFRFPVEVIEVETYQGAGGDRIYRFTPLFKDVSDEKESIEEREQRSIDISEFDTIVVGLPPENRTT